MYLRLSWSSWGLSSLNCTFHVVVKFVIISHSSQFMILIMGLVSPIWVSAASSFDILSIQFIFSIRLRHHISNTLMDIFSVSFNSRQPYKATPQDKFLCNLLFFLFFLINNVLSFHILCLFAYYVLLLSTIIKLPKYLLT